MVSRVDAIPHPVVAEAMMMLAIRHSTMPSLRMDFEAIVDRCAAWCGTDGRLAPPVAPQVPHVRRSLAVIAARHAEPRLSLRDVADTVNLSPWHLTRLLKRHTGDGFVMHVHLSRICAAERLLSQTRLAVKAVAATVGYTSTSQLDRHFRELRGTTPVSYRRRLQSAQ